MQPGAKHQGSVRSLLEGKEDVDIAGVELAKEQVQLKDFECFDIQNNKFILLILIQF